eukprot:TRINITY_DN7703_c0_g1_i1.p1 TRINITY_DN7703_c0_g1~~TRINITY_DN7703_c0_g1_i1.p1  ORF type:complete len:162 (-),score=13.06 TRINITY_DN7703_c0_g1_i1:17-502(-)
MGPDDELSRRSDGTQPHTITLQFPRRTVVVALMLYISLKSDESYTPLKISIKSGTNLQDLAEVHLLELEQPEGWVKVMLNRIQLPPGVAPTGLQREHQRALTATGGLHTHAIQLAILCNHQNGRDSHLRQLKVYGLRPGAQSVHPLPAFTTLKFQSYATIR